MVVELRARPSAPWWVPVAFTLVAVLLVALSMAFFDRPWATYAHDVLRRPAWAIFLPKLAYAPPPLAILGLIGCAATYLRHRPLNRAWRTVLQAASATLIATVCVILLKVACGRLWPETWVDNNPSFIRDHAFGFLPFHRGPGYESFPSGHMTRITAPFAVLWARLPRLRPAWVLGPALVMLGLLALDFHWISDCIAGIWLGSAAAWVVLLAL